MDTKHLHRRLVAFAYLASLMLVGSCAKENSSAETQGKAKGLGFLVTGERVTAELLPELRERRLHPDRATASSFLWNDWNRFQENYHPLYLVDDDPKTAWVEGVAGHGDGEWVKVHTTRVAAVTKVRLRLRNGYHKSM